MSIQNPADTGESYATLAHFAPPTAHKAQFSEALTQVLAKVQQLVPVFGLRNPRMGIADTFAYDFCTEDDLYRPSKLQCCGKIYRSLDETT